MIKLMRKANYNTFKDANLFFSLRDVFGVGDIIEVVRQSDITVQKFKAYQITNGDLVNFCNGSEGRVSWWKEQTGSGNDAVQTDNAKRPIIVDSNGNLITENGKPSILATGSQNLIALNLPFSNTDNISVYTVGKYSNTNSNAKYIYNITTSGPTSSDNFIANRSFNNDFNSLINNSTGFKINTITPSDINFNLFVDKLKNGNLIKKVNTTQNIVTGYSQFSPTKLYLFSAKSNGGFHEGKISEFIVYKQQDAPTDIETELNNYYNIY